MPVGDGGARSRPGDILVLVRQRGALFEAVIRALKEADIEVAGADRLMLTEHIAVMDLIALADALLLPRRRSGARERAEEPAVRTDRRAAVRAGLEAQGHAARGAAREGGRSGLRWTCTHGSSATPHGRGTNRPFGFYARILGADKGRARFYARLGAGGGRRAR